MYRHAATPPVDITASPPATYVAFLHIYTMDFKRDKGWLKCAGVAPKGRCSQQIDHQRQKYRQESIGKRGQKDSTWWSLKKSRMLTHFRYACWRHVDYDTIYMKMLDYVTGGRLWTGADGGDEISLPIWNLLAWLTMGLPAPSEPPSCGTSSRWLQLHARRALPLDAPFKDGSLLGWKY